MKPVHYYKTVSKTKLTRHIRYIKYNYAQGIMQVITLSRAEGGFLQLNNKLIMRDHSEYQQLQSELTDVHRVQENVFTAQLEVYKDMDSMIMSE